MTVKIVLIVLYALLTLALVTLKALKIGNRRRGVVKMLTSALFVGISVYGCVLQQGQTDIILAAGLFFAALGDLLLVFMDERKCFVAGTMSFAVASTVLSVYGIIRFGFSFWTFLPYAVFMALNIFAQVKKLYVFGSNVVYLNVYTVCVGFCGCLGLLMACIVGSTQAILFGVGCFMYMCSDVCLGLYLLKFRRVELDIVNSLLYFPGMLLIALSLVF